MSRHPVVTLLALLLTLSCELGSLEFSFAEVSVGPAEIRRLIDRGHYADAEKAARALLQRVDSLAGSESLELAEALDLFVDAARRNGHFTNTETLQAAERAVSIRERLLGPIDTETARSLAGLGRLCFDRGEFERARHDLEKALEAQQAVPSPDQIEIARLLDDLGRLIWTLDRNRATAESLLDRAMRIKEETLDPPHPEIARSLCHLAELLQETDRHDEARQLYRRALAMQREVLGPAHPDLAESHAGLAVALGRSGKFRDTLRHQERALEILQASLRPEHPRIAEIMVRLADGKQALGQFEEARRLLEQALKIQEEALDPAHWMLGETCKKLGDALWLDGRYPDSRALYERAMAVWKGAYGPEHRKVALAHNQLAHHYKRIADFDEAIAQFEKAATIWAKLEDPLEGAALYNLGTVYTLKEDYASARMFYERARVLLEQRLDPGHPFVAASLEGLADVALYTGDQATAKSLCERALAIREKAVGPDHHSISFASLRLARVLERSGDWDGARRQLERALSVMQAAFGEDHPETAHVEHQMAGLLQRIGEDEQAFQTGLRATRASIDHSRLIVRALGASQALRFLETRPNGLDLLVSMAMDSRDLTVIRRTWDTVIRSRTLLLDELIKRQRHVIEADGLARMADDLEDARRRLATLIFRGPAGQETEHYRRLVASARRDYDDAERELAAKSASFRQQQGREEFGLAEVLRVLPEGSALVAYSRFERHALDVATESKAATGRSIPAPRSTEPFYVAFLARSAAPSPEVVPLGSADEIDRLIVAWKELASTPPRPLVTPAGKTEGECRVAGDRLRERIWDPVASRLRGERRVFVVAAGQIHLVNLAALPSGADGYLLETGPLLHHLSAERDVVDMRASPKETSMLAIGGVDFGRVTSGDPKTSNPLGLRESSAEGVHRRSPPDCAEPRSIRFGRLPGTAKEMREVAAFWNGPARTLTGTSAGEGTIKRLAPQHGVLHLATHGFFIDDRCPAATELGVIGDNPLLRAGLALAGANNRRQIADQGEDGILTAEEIASLDLSKVRWAVLSACDTGSGHVVNGEGVFGLRRAFEVAGVSTSIMSLWAVDDESTRVWMGELYRAYLEDRLSTAEAVRQASQYVLQGRKAAGRSTHPFHWGGFVAVGDWR